MKIFKLKFTNFIKIFLFFHGICCYFRFIFSSFLSLFFFLSLFIFPSLFILHREEGGGLSLIPRLRYCSLEVSHYQETMSVHSFSECFIGQKILRSNIFIEGAATVKNGIQSGEEEVRFWASRVRGVSSACYRHDHDFCFFSLYFNKIIMHNRKTEGH